MMRSLLTALSVILSAQLAGCGSNPVGSNWAEADFNKYDHNYKPLPTERLRTGMSRSELAGLFGPHLVRIGADEGGEIYKVDRWVSVAGPDYIGDRLVLRIADDRLRAWRIEKAARR
ncbi:MAG: hypothetical protein K2Z80_04415 [Xanthobacteraceae bacterium]|nr:hypothetical protein [Xanthobacteraceae bacterium]